MLLKGEKILVKLLEQDEKYEKIGLLRSEFEDFCKEQRKFFDQALTLLKKMDQERLMMIECLRRSEERAKLELAS